MTLRPRDASGRLTASRTGIAIMSMLAAMAMGGCEQVPYSGVCPCATGYRCCNDRCIPSSEQCNATNADSSLPGPNDADAMVRPKSTLGSGGAPISMETSGSGGATTSVGGSAAGGVIGYGGSQGAGGVMVTDGGLDSGGKPIDGIADSATPIEVEPEFRLGLVAGNIGGQGTLDGVGTAARFTHLCGAAWGGDDSLFVVDTDDDLERHTIRRINIKTGAVATFAGSPGHAGTGSGDGVGEAAQFLSPYGIASDGVANLFVSDSSDRTIRKIDIATRRVTTLARLPTSDVDAGEPDHFAPAGIAWDPAGRLYVADFGESTVRQVDIATGAITVLAGTKGARGSVDGVGADARFESPMGVALDGRGSLFVTDMASCTIRKIDLATREVATFAGSPGARGTSNGVGSQARFDGPGEISSDGAGYLYVGGAGAIRKIHIATATVTTLVGTLGILGSADGIGPQARFAGPAGLAFDGKGFLYVADSVNTNLRKVDMSTLAVTTIAGAPVALGYADATGTAAEFSAVMGAAADDAGNLLIADMGNRVIRKLNLRTGDVSTLAGVAGKDGTDDGRGDQARFVFPQALATDHRGNLFVTDISAYIIRKIELSTAEVTTVAGSPGAEGSLDGTGAAARFTGGMYGIAADLNGNLFVGDSQTIRKVVLATQKVTTIAGTANTPGSVDGIGSAAGFWATGGIVLDAEGNLLVQDSCTLRKVVPSTGQVTTLVGSVGRCGTADGVGSSASLSYGLAMVLDTSGNLLVADYRNSIIRKVALATNTVTTLVGVAGRAGVILGSLPAGLNQPRGLARGSDGTIYILDEGAVLDLK